MEIVNPHQMTGLKIKCEELANQLDKNLTDSDISD